MICVTSLLKHISSMCSAKACWKLVILAPNTFLTALNYHNIADLYFDDSRYTRAGTYYDSTLVNYKKNSKPYRAVKKRLDNLQDVIYYEAIAQANDSVLNLVAMSKSEQEDYFERLIKELKAEQEQKSTAQNNYINPSTSFGSKNASTPPPRLSINVFFVSSSCLINCVNSSQSPLGGHPLVLIANLSLGCGLSIKY